jgi:hypothetical protein
MGEIKSKCPECDKLLNCQLSCVIWDKYPEWYKNGDSCPCCGAAYMGEFGTIIPEGCEKSDG